MSVLGLGCGGNRVLSGATTNPSALSRFDRDVLGMAGLTHVILVDGINDLGANGIPNTSELPPHTDDVAYGPRQLVERAHARGIKVIGTTMGSTGTATRGHVPTTPWPGVPGLFLASARVPHNRSAADSLLRTCP